MAEGDDHETCLSRPEPRRTLACARHDTQHHHDRPSDRSGGGGAVNELPVAEPAGPTPSCPEEGFANTVDAPRYRLLFRSSASAGILAGVIGVSGYVCERGGADTAKITTPEDPQGVQLTDHLNSIGPPTGEGLTEHIELAFHHSLDLVPED